MSSSYNLAKRIRSHANKLLSRKIEYTDSSKLHACKEFVKAANAMVKEAHREGYSGKEVVHALTERMDALIQFLAAFAFEEIETTEKISKLPISIIALGGYGRAELNPLSDVDIMFLYPEKVKRDHLEQAQAIMVNRILYPLWDLGLKVGHSSRSIDDVFSEARAEIQSKTALLESRLITGSEPQFEGFHASYGLFYRKEDPKAYIAERLRDQNERRTKYGGTVFIQEPDIKNGVGGLRDYHNTLWMARVRLNVDTVEALAELNYLRKNELKQFNDAYEFLLRTRNELHFRSKRPTDLLTLESQPKVGLRLGYKERNLLRRVEVFMRDYYSHAQNIYQISKVVENRLALVSKPEPKVNPLRSVKHFLKARRKERIKRLDGFLIRGTEIAYETDKVFQEDPVRLIRVFRHKQQNDVELDFELGALIRASLELIDKKVIESEAANMSFRSILQEAGNVYPTLNAMHELGVLGRFVPEWGKLTCLVQHEYYHRYTADVHTLHTIRELDRVITDPEPLFETYRRELHELDLPNLLYLILFLHDIGKAKAIKDHAQSGVELADPILQRMGVNRKNRQKVSFIILNHLKMARFWQRYDLDDPETAKAFSHEMETAEQLRLLYIHTFCDARGTARGLWNHYKDTLHTTLFQRTMDVFKSEGALEDKFERDKEMTHQELLNLNLPDVSNEEIDAHFKLLPDRYFINTSKDEIILHIKMINRLLHEINQAETLATLNPVVEWKHDINRSFYVVNIVTWDRAGLFHNLAGALNIAGFNILSVKAISREDHIAIDTFNVVESDRGTIDLEKAKSVFEECVRETLVSHKDLFPKIHAAVKKANSSLFKRNDNPLAESFQPQIDVYHELSLRRTILEVQAQDHLGLLYLIAQSIHRHGFDITFARINTERGIAIDTIYLTNANPKAETDGSELMALRDSLSESLSNGSQD